MPLITWLMGILFVWALAGLFNPNIDSGMVWLIAFIYANIMTSIPDEKEDK